MDRLRFSFSKGAVVSPLMFGAKMGRDDGPNDAHTYLGPMSDIGVRAVRFSYDVGIGAFRRGDADLSTAELLHAAEEGHLPVFLTLVTKTLFKPDTDNNILTPRAIDMGKIATIKAFIKDLILSEGEASGGPARPFIQAIELGNEFWGEGEMTSAEYGKLVNVLAAQIQSAIDQTGLRGQDTPHILVQMGSPFAPEFLGNVPGQPYEHFSWNQRIVTSNQQIIAQITNPASRRAIDGMVEHYYYTEPGDVLPHTSAAMRFIDVDFKIWQANGFSNRALYITEWNNKLNNPSQFGLKGAGIVVEMFENMIRMGVDAAAFWPLQHNATSLLDTLQHLDNGEHILPPRGAVFQMMSQSLPGARLLPSNISTAEGSPYDLAAYERDDAFVIYLYSRQPKTLEINLDLSDVVSSYTKLAATKIGFDPATTDGTYYDGSWHSVKNYNDPDALAKWTVLQGFGTTKDLHFKVGAYEVIELIATLPPGLTIEGTAKGDYQLGASGKDKLRGLGGDDVLRGNAGDDTLLGGTGWDMLKGGLGNDLLDGGNGADRLFGGKGADMLTGGKEVDEFIFDTAPEQRLYDHLTDFTPGRDLIVLENAVFSGLSTTRLRTDQFVENASGKATDRYDRIIYETDTGFLSFDRDGSGRIKPIVFAKLDAHLHLSAADFLVI